MAWAPAYVTADELKAFVRIDDAADDPQVDLAIDAASRAVDQHTGRQFGQVAAPEARRYTGRWDYARWVVDIDD
ncbi:MAG TPA: head-tail connector protein, partial [Pseudonocardia sp.]